MLGVDLMCGSHLGQDFGIARRDAIPSDPLCPRIPPQPAILFLLYSNKEFSYLLEQESEYYQGHLPDGSCSDPKYYLHTNITRSDDQRILVGSQIAPGRVVSFHPLSLLNLAIVDKQARHCLHVCFLVHSTDRS